MKIKTVIAIITLILFCEVSYAQSIKGVIIKNETDGSRMGWDLSIKQPNGKVKHFHINYNECEIIIKIENKESSLQINDLKKKQKVEIVIDKSKEYCDGIKSINILKK